MEGNENKKEGIFGGFRKIWGIFCIGILAFAAAIVIFGKFLPAKKVTSSDIIAMSPEDQFLHAEYVSYTTDDDILVKIPIGIYSGENDDIRYTYEFYPLSAGKSPSGYNLWGKLTVESVNGKFQSYTEEIEAFPSTLRSDGSYGYDIYTVSNSPEESREVDFLYNACVYYHDLGWTVSSAMLDTDLLYQGWSLSQLNELKNGRPANIYDQSGESVQVQSTTEAETLPSASIIEKTVEETQPPTRAPRDNSYLIDITNQRLVEDSDLASLSKEQLRIARNEIYARHGYIFNSDDLNEYFGSKDWYSPSTQFDEAQLSEIEKENIRRIKEYEENGSINSAPMSLLSGTYTAIISDSLMSEYTISRSGSDIYFMHVQSGTQGAASEIEGIVTVLGDGRYSFDYYETDGSEFTYRDIVYMTDNGFVSEYTGANYIYDDYR